MIHSGPPKVPQKPAQAFLGAAEIDIVAQPGPQRRPNLARLFRVDFPWVQVKDAGCAQLVARLAQRRPSDGVWQQAEIAPARRRKIAAEQAHRRQRDLDEAGLRAERAPRRLRRAVEIVHDRIDTGTVAEPLFRQDRVRPAALHSDRKGRRAIACHRDAADILQQCFAAPDVVAEFFGRLPVDAVMVRAMTSQFVAFGNDPPHQLGMPLGDPAEHEKRAADAGLGENIQQAVRVPSDPARKRVPIAAIDDPGERLDLEIILDVHREGVPTMHYGVQGVSGTVLAENVSGKAGDRARRGSR